RIERHAVRAAEGERRRYTVANLRVLAHHDGSTGLEERLPMNLPPDKQREMLRQMLTIRCFEERASADYHAGKIYGVFHCYICENNMYAAQTSAAETHAMPDVAGRAAGYGIPGVVVDGNDIFAIHQAAARAIARARAGEGPTLIECKTFRWRAHTERIGQPDF